MGSPANLQYPTKTAGIPAIQRCRSSDRFQWSRLTNRRRIKRPLCTLKLWAQKPPFPGIMNASLSVFEYRGPVRLVICTPCPEKLGRPALGAHFNWASAVGNFESALNLKLRGNNLEIPISYVRWTFAQTTQSNTVLNHCPWFPSQVFCNQDGRVYQLSLRGL